MFKIFRKLNYKKFKQIKEDRVNFYTGKPVQDDKDEGWSYGIGITLNKKHEIIVMVINSQIYKNTPIKLGDKILSIDGYDLDKIDNMKYLMRGDKNSIIKLEVLDKKTKKISNHVLTRDIKLSTVFNIKKELVKLEEE